MFFFYLGMLVVSMGMFGFMMVNKLRIGFFGLLVSGYVFVF